MRNLSHSPTAHGPDRPLRLGTAIILTVVCYALLGMVLGWLARAWWGPLA